MPCRIVYKPAADRTWRIWVGDYRVLYEVDDAAQVVRVTRAGRRRDIYGASPGPPELPLTTSRLPFQASAPRSELPRGTSPAPCLPTPKA